MCVRASTLLLAVALAFVSGVALTQGGCVGKTRSPKLTDMQAAFVDNYLVTFSAKKAAIAAGYSQATARMQGAQLLNNPNVAKALSKAMEARAERLELRADKFLQEVAKIAYSDIRDVADFGPDGVTIFSAEDITDDAAAAIAEIVENKTARREDRHSKAEIITSKIKVKLHSKLKALEIVGRHLGLIGLADTGTLPASAPTAVPKVSFEQFCINAGYPPPFPKQIEMKDFVVRGTEPRMLLGTRGIGKTEYTTILGVAYEIYLDPDDTTILGTKVQTSGRRMLKAAARALEANGVELEISNTNEIRVVGCTRKENNIMLVTIGSGGFRTNHPKRVVFDDPVVPGYVAESDREEVKIAYEEAIKLTKNIAIIGQPVDFRDLYAHLRGIVKTMEVPYGSIPELDHDLDAQRAAGVDEKSIQASYFLKVSPEGDASFHDIQRIPKFPTSEPAYAFIDPADGGDYTAIGGFGPYFEGMAIVGRAFRKAWHNCLPEIYEFCERYNVKKLGFETNKFGTDPLTKLRELLAPLGISVEGKYTHSNKEARIALAAQFSKSMHLSKESDVEFIRQVVEYAHDAKYDDSPDAIATFLEWAGKIRPPKAVKKPSEDL